MKKLKLMNFNDERFDTEIDLDKLNEISKIEIEVITGDEVATITYKTGVVLTIDSAVLANCLRSEDFYDGNYILYSDEDGINRLEEFEKRTHSYWFW